MSRLQNLPARCIEFLPASLFFPLTNDRNVGGMRCYRTIKCGSHARQLDYIISSDCRVRWLTRSSDAVNYYTAVRPRPRIAPISGFMAWIIFGLQILPRLRAMDTV
ncbi:hypothetical protein C8Q77DRAFT_460841 [Trametes polyzona]|nr:hypothetical protein C8Q77DRAFT_460841 [Trametes polyzona]